MFCFLFRFLFLGSGLLQVEQASSGGFMWIISMPSIIAPYQYLGKKWLQTTLRPCLCIQSVLLFSRYVLSAMECSFACIC